MKNVYKAVSGIPFLSRSYTAKFLFIAFIGIHIPLIVLIIVISSGFIQLTGWQVVLTTLFATLAATAATLLALRGLLWPLNQAQSALSDYVKKEKLPELPVNYTDEAGLLLKEIQHTLHEQDKLLQERSELVTLFSHDIRSPLATLDSLAHLIELETDLSRTKKHAATMKQTARQQLKLLEDILQMLRLGHPAAFNTDHAEALALVIQDAVEQHQFKAKEKNVQIITGDLPQTMLYCSPNLLCQAISNLIGNAVKFSHPGNIVEIEAGLNSRKEAFIRISDKGIGFNPADTADLFGRFSGKRQSGTAGEKSTGLGLYLTRQILRRHGGEVTACSEGKGRGAVFTITLPVVH
ncbi:sensor histidine kinase [Sediminibacterium ginsengisoli]|uniref:histidine kinase n=1 Tax=Sediminibacterium ginsengisoli TaxID=413434 RepID=A0A1T4QQM3_9BACT|nr:HAMP domain-containing sensor histidine kinase [Sediminibacterium ginsengisoli]SKA05781.1 Signal transduction histidine kinase [Sediminibacterium ginsengisoli]